MCQSTLCQSPNCQSPICQIKECWISLCQSSTCETLYLKPVSSCQGVVVGNSIHMGWETNQGDTVFEACQQLPEGGWHGIQRRSWTYQGKFQGIQTETLYLKPDPGSRSSYFKFEYEWTWTGSGSGLALNNFKVYRQRHSETLSKTHARPTRDP